MTGDINHIVPYLSRGVISVFVLRIEVDREGKQRDVPLKRPVSFQYQEIIGKVNSYSYIIINKIIIIMLEL